MKCYDFDWQINEFMVYCRSTQLRERTMYSYEQTLRLFERWLCDELKIYSVDKVTENMIRKYINDLRCFLPVAFKFRFQCKEQWTFHRLLVGQFDKTNISR